MKKTMKCGIAAAVLVVAGFTAYQSYSSYGVQDNSLLMQNVEALAQSPEPEGDPSGGGCRYTNKSGDAKFCDLYVYVDVNGKVVYSGSEENKQLEISGKYEKKRTQGLKDRCPDKGSGCNPYSCQEVKY